MFPSREGGGEKRKKTPPQIKTLTTLSHLASRKKNLRKLLKSYRTLDTLCFAPQKNSKKIKSIDFTLYIYIYCA
jgi:hypothetical protein